MADCSSDCGSDCSSGCGSAAALEPGARTCAAAERLACLLVETEIFQSFARHSRAVQVDGEVSEIMQELRLASFGSPADTAALRERFEALPAVQEYRQAEAAVRALFQAVDGAVSAGAGLTFAENAKPGACG